VVRSCLNLPVLLARADGWNRLGACIFAWRAHMLVHFRVWAHFRFVFCLRVSDNAPSHLKVDDPQFCEVAKQGGFDIWLICQPPNSLDFNILDLRIFRAI
jgi:hypothetical protein